MSPFQAKLALLQIAATLTEASMAGTGSQLAGSPSAAVPAPGFVPIDPTLQDPTVKAENLEVFEKWRSYYFALVGYAAANGRPAVPGILADDVNWPSPPVPASETAPIATAGGQAAGQVLQAGLAQLGLTSDVIGEVLNLVKAGAAGLGTPPPITPNTATPAPAAK